MKKSYHIQNAPFVVPTTDGKIIEEHWGRATDGNQEISIAHMVAPSGWSEPFQTPEAGQSIKINKNTRIQYSNPFDEACEYIAICTPAFSPDTVHREA